MTDARVSRVAQSLLSKSVINRRSKLSIVNEGGMRIEHVERASVADRHQRQALAFGQPEDAHIESVESHRIDGSQLACTGASCGLELNEFEAEPGCNPVRRFVKLCTGRAGGAAGVIGEPHGRSPRLRYRRAAALAGVLRRRNVLIGSILPRMSRRSTRGRLLSALRPRTRSTSALGSM